MTDLLNREDLKPAAYRFASACSASREHDAVARRALATYGDHGAQISGCVRDHFPDRVKDDLRTLARLVSTMSDEAYAMRPLRVRMSTMRTLARDVATRDGSGFYGPQGRR